ncbi:aryl-alcohol dehydrogenase [Laetiporus sulphureus 93-53]|uniref:Aryl-alcohol dehydrogenase n=1 Tax=Laetiporus sulphureus 93-53 TaxID=1314785 RepID=A0A165CW72_9APHY|nr:aryl-alcohol dehydrogenase [Laetiporus sulphureus 93-53]KZT03560.1 aryl-alcohol dehydrogenase [Laetiporus sulphureus 93-53]
MSALDQSVLPPATRLGHYRQLAPRAAIHVSPFALGGASIGDKWAKSGQRFGEMNKDMSFKLLDAFYDAGGNFIDTANFYQDGSSELWIGEWVELRGIRDQLVICTKYTGDTKRGDSSVKQRANYVGNNIKSMKLGLEESLRRLRTTYIDLFYVHFWDLHTSVEEFMDGLHVLVQQGKVLYLGISDAPAWLVVKANEYAKANGKTPFVVYQAKYSLLKRDIESDILPMCRHEGIALTLFNILEGGHIRSDEEEERRRRTGEKGRVRNESWERSPDEKKMCDALEAIAKQVGAKNITAIAIAYVMHKAPFMFPIVGGRKVEHLHANLEALEISLTPEQMSYLEGVLPFKKGYPHDALGEYGDYPTWIHMSAKFDVQPMLPPITPSK